jgi:hypothetical protein
MKSGYIPSVGCRMNLKQFFNYRKNCPLCDSPLTTYLHSKKRQVIKYENNRAVVIFPLTSIKSKKTEHKVGYSFGLDDHSFCVEFYDKNLFRYEKEVPLFLINRFKELSKNLKELRFYRVCNNCQRYNYISFSFKIDFKNNILKPWRLRSEYFGFIQNYGGGLDDRYRIYRVTNWHSLGNDGENESWINYWITKNVFEAEFDSPMPVPVNSLHLPFIPFVSKEETLERIKKLILFS